MSLRKLEASVPRQNRQTVLDALTRDGGIGHETHVGEFIVVRECENCVVISVVCSSSRAGELMNVLTSHGVGVLYGTLTSIQVASQRPNPIALVHEFRELKAKIERRAETELKHDRDGTRRWNRTKAKLEHRKIEYITSTAGKSVEELYNEIVDMGEDGYRFYVGVACASVIAGIGLLTDAPVIVLSAMLISPLMGPILSSAFGLAIGDWVLFWESIKAEARAAAVTFAMGAVLGAAYGPYANARGDAQLPTREMESRGQVSTLLGGFIIAIASGVVVALSISSDGVNSLVGVAISASLLPPIVNSGASLVIGALAGVLDDETLASRETLFREAGVSFALYAMNVVTIVLVAGFVFYNQKIGRFKGFLKRHGAAADLLNVGNKHVREKLHLATGIKGAVGEASFDKLLDSATEKKRGRRDDAVGFEEARSPDEGTRGTVDVDAVVDVVVDVDVVVAEGERLETPAAAVSSDYSVLRPFDEPHGVARPAFAAAEQSSHVFGWLKSILSMTRAERAS
jgi:uncharacterized hydrophobic protein (TIGR00271 family)